jgi:guanine deaminase
MKKKRKKNNLKLKFIKKCIRIAHINVLKRGGGPFGALVVKNGKIIAEGYNQVTELNDPTAHAEIQAIRKAAEILGSFELKGCELYTSCEPCPMCLGAIYWARPDAVYFVATRKDAASAGFDDDLIYKEIKLSPEKRKIPMLQITSKDKLLAFKAWKKKENKILY